MRPLTDVSINVAHVPQQSTGEEKGDLEHDGKALGEKVERPLLQTIVFVLLVATALDHQPSSVAEVPVQPLLAQNCNEANSDIINLHTEGLR